jgi:hypothetical protein
VQRYLTTSVVDAARDSLLMSALWKIPLQALVLLVGVLDVSLLLYTPSPMLFNRVHDAGDAERTAGDGVRALETLRGSDGIEVGRGARDDSAEAAGDGRSLERDVRVPASGRRDASGRT